MPIFIIFFILIEFMPPCRGLKVIGINFIFSFFLTYITEIITLERLKSFGIKEMFFSRVSAFIRRNGVFASNIFTPKQSFKAILSTLVTIIREIRLVLHSGDQLSCHNLLSVSKTAKTLQDLSVHLNPFGKYSQHHF